MSENLLPCPFCGEAEPEFERLGDGRQSCIVACGWCGCRHESGDEDEHNGWSWNQRDNPLKWLSGKPTIPAKYIVRFKGAGDLGWDVKRLTEADLALDTPSAIEWFAERQFCGPLVVEEPEE